MVFRVVTDSHPGDPALEEFGCPRTEYVYSTDPLVWTVKRDDALRFPDHRDAEAFAHPQKWHAVVAGADEDAIPERLRAIVPETLRPASPVIRNRGRKKKAKADRNRRDWVMETYG